MIDSSAEPDIVVGSREQLFHLLAEASEIEHTLMCSYLYAAFSLRRVGDPSLSATEAQAVERWRKIIMAVATEEMLHLLLVANLFTAIGGRPHFDRPNFPVSPGYFPSGVVVKLTPFSLSTLKHFIYLERPKGSEGEDGEGFEHPHEYRRGEAYDGLMPSVQDYGTVGHLYEAIRLNLTSLARRLGEDALFLGPPSAQVGVDVVHLKGLNVVSDLDSALRAIETIVEQGEGSPSDQGDSHYQRFRSIESEFQELLARNPAFQPAWPAASNPVMRRPADAGNQIFIDDPIAARVLDLANAVYGLLLRCLVQSFGRVGPSASSWANAFISTAIDLMHVLAGLGSLLVRLPASAATSGVNAGMTFTMLRSVDPLFIGEAESQLPLERLAELARGAERLAQQVPELSPLAATLRRLESQRSRGWTRQD